MLLLYISAFVAFLCFLCKRAIIFQINVFVAKLITNQQLKQNEKKRLNSLKDFQSVRKIEIKRPQEDSQMVPLSSTPLTPFDILNNVPINLLFLYDEILEEDVLIDSISKLLTFFPELGSKTVISDDKKNVFFSYSPEPKIQLVIAESNEIEESSEETKRKIFPNFLDNNLKISMSMNDSKYIDVVDYGYPIANNVDVFKVQFTKFPKIGYSIIGFSVNHAVADAGSLFSMAQFWASIARGYNQSRISPKSNILLPDLEIHLNQKSKIPSRDVICSYKDNNIKSLELKGNFRKKLILSRVLSIVGNIKKFGKCETKLFTFHRHKINEFKQNLIRSFPDSSQSILSTNDIISCIMWKQLAKHSAVCDPKVNNLNNPFPLLFVVNGRGVPLPHNFKDFGFPAHISDNYFGNFTFFAKVNFTRAEVMQKSTLDLMIAARKAIMEIRDPKSMHEIIVSLTNSHREGGIFSYLSTCIPVDFTGLFVSNWSKNPLLECANFNGKNPIAMSLPSPVLPNLAVITTLNDGDDEIQFILSTSSSIINQLNVVYE